MITLDEEPVMLLGERLKRLLKFNKWSQRHLAKLTEIDESSISTLMHYKRKPSVYELRVLAHIFNVPYEFLVGEMPTFDEILIRATDDAKVKAINLW